MITNSRGLLAVGLLFAVALKPLPAADAARATTVILVDPSHPAAPETITGAPRFSTLEAARDYVRTLPAAQRAGRVEIRLASGAHVLTSPVVFSLADSPPAAGRLVINSDPARPATLRGSVAATDWKRLDEGHPDLPAAAVGHVWVAPLPTAVPGKVFALFGPDGRLPRARSGQLAIYGRPAGYEGKWDVRHQFSFKHGLIRPWANFQDVELGIVPARQFMMNLLELDSLDSARSVELPQQIDLVTALHACDTATDDAISWAVNADAKLALIAPCCHHDIQAQMNEIPEPWQMMTRNGIMKERLGDLITDALRMQIMKLRGYRVEAIEFIGGEHTPRNLMIRAVKTGAIADAAEKLRYEEMVSLWKVKPALASLLNR